MIIINIIVTILPGATRGLDPLNLPEESSPDWVKSQAGVPNNVQTLMMTDVQTPFLWTPLGPLKRMAAWQTMFGLRVPFSGSHPP